jgi:hypothetical protein
MWCAVSCPAMWTCEPREETCGRPKGRSTSRAKLHVTKPARLAGPADGYKADNHAAPAQGSERVGPTVVQSHASRRSQSKNLALAVLTRGRHCIWVAPAQATLEPPESRVTARGVPQSRTRDRKRRTDPEVWHPEPFFAPSSDRIGEKTGGGSARWQPAQNAIGQHNTAATPIVAS